MTLPNNLQPQLSPWSPIGEIFRYQLVGPGYTLNEIKATQDWLVRRELKQVPGIIDITTFGGTTRQYQIETDPNKLLSYRRYAAAGAERGAVVECERGRQLPCSLAIKTSMFASDRPGAHTLKTSGPSS